jgi:predicted HTH domain antitoxin
MVEYVCLSVECMSLESVVDEFPLFKERGEKERFLVVLGLLASRSVSLGKAAEIMAMSSQAFSTLLKSVGFKYSYLDDEEAKKELKTAKNLLKKRCN